MPTFQEEFLPNHDPEELPFFNQRLLMDVDACLDPQFILTRDSLTRIQIPYREYFERFRNHIMEAIQNDNRREFFRLVNVSEPPEVGLGYSLNNGRHGSAFGDDLSVLFTEGIWTFRTELVELGVLELGNLLVDNVGPDRIGDLATNVLKRPLIQFTQEICRNYNIDMSVVEVRNIYNFETRQWEVQRVSLPINGFDNHINNGIILVPRGHIRGDLVMGYNEFRTYFLDRIITPEIRERIGLDEGVIPDKVTIRNYLRGNIRILNGFVRERNMKLREIYRTGRFRLQPRKQNETNE